LHKLSSSFVLGYHGCDKSVGEKLLAGDSFKKSENEYDWLGHGIYFWEANPQRGIDYVREMSRLPRFKDKFKNPFVVGAVIDLGNCLDMQTKKSVDFVRTAYEGLREVAAQANFDLPVNSKDGILRKLDCAVIKYLHEVVHDMGQPAIDSVKGVFIEGEPIYPLSGFNEKTHIQICVCNPDCIKGVFRVSDKFFS